MLNYNIKEYEAFKEKEHDPDTMQFTSETSARTFRTLKQNHLLGLLSQHLMLRNLKLLLLNEEFHRHHESPLMHIQAMIQVTHLMGPLSYQG